MARVLREIPVARSGQTHTFTLRTSDEATKAQQIMLGLARRFQVGAIKVEGRTVIVTIRQLEPLHQYREILEDLCLTGVCMAVGTLSYFTTDAAADPAFEEEIKSMNTWRPGRQRACTHRKHRHPEENKERFQRLMRARKEQAASS